LDIPQERPGLIFHIWENKACWSMLVQATDLQRRGMIALQYFEVTGCPDVGCPLCKGKAGYLSCPSCGYQVPRREARILKEKDFFLAVRHTGVYCPRCWKLMFSEAQAQLLGIHGEE